MTENTITTVYQHKFAIKRDRKEPLCLSDAQIAHDIQELYGPS